MWYEHLKVCLVGLCEKIKFKTSSSVQPFILFYFTDFSSCTEENNVNINGRDNQEYSVTLVTCSSARGQWMKVGPSDMASQWNYTDEDLEDNTFQVITDEEAAMIANLDAVNFVVCIPYIIFLFQMSVFGSLTSLFSV